MLPGLPPYLPNLIQSLTQDTGIAFPSSIFTSLLLCMVAGNNKHLILRTNREEDVEEVKALVVRVLVTIFGLPTQRIALRPDDTAADFLSDIFLVPPPPPTSSNTGSSPTAMAAATFKPRHGRMGSTNSATTSATKRNRSQRRIARLERSESGSSVGIPPHHASDSVLSGHAGRSQHGRTPSTGTVTQQSMVDSRVRKKSLASSGTFTINTLATASGGGPGTSPISRKRRSSGMMGLLPVPQGLDSDAASMRALRPESTHGLHIETNPPTPTTPFVGLPSMLSSPGEYPPSSSQHHRNHVPHHHHSYFTPPPTVTPRLPHALVVSKLEKAKVSVQNALADVLRSGRVVSMVDARNGWDDDELDGDGDDVAEEPAPYWNLPSGFVTVFVCPYGDGREKVGIERSLLDRFAFNGRIKLEPELYNSSPGPFRRTALISREDIERLQGLCTAVHISPRLQNYTSSLMSATRMHPLLDGTLLTARCVADYTDLIRASRVVLGRYESGGGQISATDADARRMFTGTLEHRLSVRKRPEDGVLGSLYATAVGSTERGKKEKKRDLDASYAADDEGRWAHETGGDEEDDRDTVVTVLKTILADV